MEETNEFYYIIEVQYSYNKYFELNYDVVAVIEEKNENLVDYELNKITSNNKTCYVSLLCKSTEDFIYQLIKNVILPINEWSCDENLDFCDYENIKNYINNVLKSVKFIENNKIFISNSAGYTNRTYVFDILLDILNNKRIETEDYSS